MSLKQSYGKDRFVLVFQIKETKNHSRCMIPGKPEPLPLSIFKKSLNDQHRAHESLITQNSSNDTHTHTHTRAQENPAPQDRIPTAKKKGKKKEAARSALMFISLSDASSSSQKHHQKPVCMQRKNSVPASARAHTLGFHAALEKELSRVYTRFATISSPFFRGCSRSLVKARDSLSYICGDSKFAQAPRADAGRRGD